MNHELSPPSIFQKRRLNLMGPCFPFGILPQTEGLLPPTSSGHTSLVQTATLAEPSLLAGEDSPVVPRNWCTVQCRTTPFDINFRREADVSLGILPVPNILASISYLWKVEICKRRFCNWPNHSWSLWCVVLGSVR